MSTSVDFIGRDLPIKYGRIINNSMICDWQKINELKYIEIIASFFNNILYIIYILKKCVGDCTMRHDIIRYNITMCTTNQELMVKSSGEQRMANVYNATNLNAGIVFFAHKKTMYLGKTHWKCNISQTCNKRHENRHIYTLLQRSQWLGEPNDGDTIYAASSLSNIAFFFNFQNNHAHFHANNCFQLKTLKDIAFLVNIMF